MEPNALQPTAAISTRPLYANFPGRLNALTIDSVVVIAFSALLFFLASVLQSIPAARITLVVLWWLTLFLYEPLFVWRFGGTVGHRAMNLRVVDNRTGGKISLPKALGRLLIKGVLGIFSFLTMSFTRRHQAIHDLVTNSSVRIRDEARARPHQYTVGTL